MRKRMMEKLRKISTMYYVRQIVACLLVCYMLFGIPVQVAQAFDPPATTALPSGGTVPAGYGSANFDYTTLNTLDIDGLAARTVINWEDFDIGSMSTVNFDDAANFAVLNRVTGNTGTTGIYGDLFANGTIFVINTRGIVFGPESFIQARNFVASGIDIQNQNFIDGIYQFERFTPAEVHPYSNLIGNVTNAGINPDKGINADNVALIGHNVTNKGVIRTAPGGAVIMAAGERVFLSEIGSNVVVEVDMTDPAYPHEPDKHVVDNGGDVGGGPGTGPGKIYAPVGKVVLAAGDIFSVAISGVDSLAATAHGDITLNTGNGDFEAGEMTLTADFDNSTAGNVDINTGVNLTGGTFTAKGVDFDNTGGDITTNDGKVDIQNTGDVTVGAAIDAGAGDVDIDGGDPGVATSITGGGTITSSGTTNLEASGSIGGEGAAINTASIGTINASSTDTGDIYIDNTGAVTLETVKTNASDIVINNTGELTIDYLEAGGEGNVSLTTISSDVSSGDVIVNDVKAIDNKITINSAGAILEYGNDAAVDLTAKILDLTANDGIAVDPVWMQWYIETAANTITARTIDENKTLANIWLSNNNDSTTSLIASTVGPFSQITFEQKGGGELTLTDVSTDNGSIYINAEEGDIVATQVNAGGFGNVELRTITSGNVLVDDVKALGNIITIDSAGAIKGFSVPTIFDPHLTADTLDLTANDGIGWPASSYIQTAANTIIARTDDDTKTSAHIRLINDNSSPTSLTASTVGTDSWVRFSQRGGGELTLTDVSTVNGGIVIEAKEGDIVAKLVNAGGQFGDVYLYTYDSSGDIAVGSVTAAGSGVGVEISSAGSINDAADDKTVDITARHLNLFARDEIGGSPTAGKTNDTLGAIETDVETLYAHSTGLGGEDGGGDIVIVETDNVELEDVIAESGSIFLEATNGGMTHVIPDEGTFTIEAGSSTLTLVQQDDLDLAGFTFANQANTDLMMESYNGSITAVDTANGGKDENAADQWQSIQAIAEDNIVLQGSDAEEDIKIGTHEGFDPLSHPFGGVVDSWDGGVSIISENGAVRTAGNDILDDVEIWGVSDDELGIGVDLPYGPGKAAIVIMSEETLTLGENTILTASGWYDPTGDVDDRAGVGFLDEPASIPSGFPRYKGDPFDAAIYLASTGGDVQVSGPVSITSQNMILDGFNNGVFDVRPLNGDGEPIFEYVHQGAMVIDAFDSVTFGDIGSPFEVSLENGDVGDRLEVVSRITEWLFQAAGRLPYSGYPYYGGGPFPLDYTYVLRGAGLENPVISNITEGIGRAWVLVDPEPAPLYEEAGEAAERLTLGLQGCPVLVAAVSAELGIPEDTIQVSLANSFALNTNIQPCESCARLVNAAEILSDEDGSGMAALNQVFNTVAPADTPFTPEMAASIATAFAGRVNDGTQYATAIEYIDAFVRYIAVLDTEMGSPVGDGDSIAFVMGKYGTGITDSDNSNIAAFVATRLESGATFGE